MWLADRVGLQYPAGQGTQRGLEPIAANADLQQRRDLEIVLLAALGELAPLDTAGKDVVPVQALDLALDLQGRQAAGIQATHDGAHGGAGNHVHRDALALQHLEHAHMGQAPRAAAGQHQAHFGAVGPRWQARQTTQEQGAHRAANRQT